MFTLIFKKRKRIKMMRSSVSLASVSGHKVFLGRGPGLKPYT